MSKFPQSTPFEFYCHANRMDLTEYRKERSNAVLDEKALDQFAEYYDDITYDAVNQIFIVEKNEKINFVRESDMKLAPPLFDFCHLYPGFAVVRKGNQVGNLFFHEGISEPESYRTVDIFEMKRGNLFGVETASGDTLLECKYRFVKVYPNLILAQTDEGYSFFYPDGRRMFDDCFEEVDLTSLHLWQYLFVQKNGYWGVIHERGHWIVPALFRNKTDIYNEFEWWPGYFYCSLNGKKGLYNQQGKLVIPFEYEKIESCDGCYGPAPFMVTNNGKDGLLDHSGTVIFPCIYDKITRMDRHHFRMRKEGTDQIWQINFSKEYEPASVSEPVTTCQLLDSSCCYFFKIAWSLQRIGEEFFVPQEWMDKKSEELDDQKAIRWLLMGIVCDSYQFGFSDFKYLSDRFNDLSIRNDELSFLFELERIRKDRKVIKSNYDDSENEFSSAFTLAGIFFEGKKVRVNYSHAFELYRYCLDVIQRKYESELNTKFDVLTAILVNGSENLDEGKVYISDITFQKYVLVAYRMGWMLFTGNGVEKDEQAGTELLTASQIHKDMEVVKITFNENPPPVNTDGDDGLPF